MLPRGYYEGMACGSREQAGVKAGWRPEHILSHLKGSLPYNGLPCSIIVRALITFQTLGLRRLLDTSTTFAYGG